MKRMNLVFSLVIVSAMLILADRALAGDSKNQVLGAATTGYEVIELTEPVMEDIVVTAPRYHGSETSQPGSNSGNNSVITASFTHDKAKDGWTLLEDVPFDGKRFVPDLVEFLKPGEISVSGEVMKQRAKELNVHLGQHHAEYLLEHQELIPKEWRGKYVLTFPGTVWHDAFSNRRSPFLFWFGDHWDLCIVSLDGFCGSDGRLVRSLE